MVPDRYWLLLPVVPYVCIYIYIYIHLYLDNLYIHFLYALCVENVCISLEICWRSPPIGWETSKSFSEQFEAGTRLQFTIVLICFILCQLVHSKFGPWTTRVLNWRFMEIQLGSAGKNHPLQGVTTQAFQRLLDWTHLTSRHNLITDH